MKIQSKIIMIVSVLILVYSVIALSLQYMYLQPEIEHISTEMAQKDMVKSINALSDALQNLSIMTHDYAIWDQSYLFVEGNNPLYATEHISNDAMTAAGISIILFYDKENKLYFSKYLNEENIWASLDEGALIDYASNFAQQQAPTNGLAYINQQLYLLAIEPILHTDKSGPSNGKIIFGKSLNSIYTDKLLTTLELNLQLYLPNNLNKNVASNIKSLFSKNPDIALLGTAQGTDYVLVDKSPISMTGYCFINDLLGKPSLLLQTDTEKTIAILGRKFSYFSALSIATCGLLISLLLIIFFRQVIVRPILALSDMVSSFDLKDTAREDHSQLIKRTDEIGTLAKDIQKMAHLVVEKHGEVLNLNRQLDAKVTERTLALKLANDSLQLSDKVLNETSEGILIIDSQLKIIRVNDAFLKISRYRRDELIGQSPSIFRSDYHTPKFYQHIWQEVHSTSHWSGEFWSKYKDGSFYPVLLTINIIKNDKGQITNYMAFASDITYIKETEHTLERLAYFDSLTELPNRELFHDRLNHAIRRTLRNKSISALLFIDLDRFKMINDTLGHATGDEVLIEVSKRLNMRVRDSDTVSRLGGDEFTIILENINDAADAKRIAEDLISLVGTPIQTSEQTVNVSASIGIALIPNDDVTLDGIMRKADAAMYAAKENGRNQVCFSSQDIERRNQESLEIQNNLRKAIVASDFQLYLQPKVKLMNKKYVVAGAEALIRWINPEGQMVSPDLFIGVAEETGLIHPIGKWVLEEACRHHLALKENGYSVPISVNLSAKQLEREDLIDEIQGVLSHYDIPPHMIEFELTENMFLKDFQEAISKLEAIKKMGSEIAIDDFGKGYSSMSYIGSLPVDCLKIDKAFIDPIGQNNEKELVSAFIAIAKTHSFKTVAEGVENEAQRDFLIHLGCDEMQGYLFSKPLPFKDFLAYMASKPV